jgi:hypothetical protein
MSRIAKDRCISPPLWIERVVAVLREIIVRGVLKVA